MVPQCSMAKQLLLVGDTTVIHATHPHPNDRWSLVTTELFCWELLFQINISGVALFSSFCSKVVYLILPQVHWPLLRNPLATDHPLPSSHLSSVSFTGFYLSLSSIGRISPSPSFYMIDLSVLNQSWASNITQTLMKSHSASLTHPFLDLRYILW